MAIQVLRLFAEILRGPIRNSPNFPQKLRPKTSLADQVNWANTPEHFDISGDRPVVRVHPLKANFPVILPGDEAAQGRAAQPRPLSFSWLAGTSAIGPVADFSPPKSDHGTLTERIVFIASLRKVNSNT
jgi:hypothetical protein